MMKSRKPINFRLILLLAIIVSFWSIVYMFTQHYTISGKYTLQTIITTDPFAETITPPVLGIEKTSITPTIMPNPTRTLRPINTLTPTILPTYTPLPSLNTTQVEENVKQFLSENIACQSPCIWGVMPGITSFGEAKNIFRQLKSPLRRANLLGEEYYESSWRLTDDLSTGLILRVRDDSILNIHFWIGFTNYKGRNTSVDWTAFKLSNILKEYSTPTNVEFFVTFPVEPGLSPKTAWYDMILIYANQDLIIQYSSAKVDNTDLILVCPHMDHFDGIEMWLGKELEHTPFAGIPLGKVTTLSIEEFLENFKQEGDDACFYLNTIGFK